MRKGASGRWWAIAAIAAAAAFVWTLLGRRREASLPARGSGTPPPGESSDAPRRSTGALERASDATRERSTPPAVPGAPAGAARRADEAAEHASGAGATTKVGAGALGRPAQWVGAIALAAAIAIGWTALQTRVPSQPAPTDSALNGRRVAVETALAFPSRATRVALAPPARATRLPRPSEVPVEHPPTAGVAAGVAAVTGAKREILPFRAMGYNPTYATAEVPPDRRLALLRRDMRAMSDVGVNLVLGWEPGVFDEELLRAARENDVWVMLPFELKPEWNYADPKQRLEIMGSAAAWVRRYRDYPSVVMWGIGNEVTLEMDDAQRRDFADFYVGLFEMVRALDPTRPVILREAEDVFAPYLAAAFAQRQGIVIEPTATATQFDPDAVIDPDAEIPTPVPPTPMPIVTAPEGFVYGVNFYTDRIGPALTDWVETTRLDAPLFVSEYAPAGMSRVQRPGGFVHMFGLIQGVGPRVIGSAPYTWTTAGPEAVDAYFGLVDEEARPVDATLEQVARLYGVEPPGWTRGVGPAAMIATAADLPRLIDDATVRAADAMDEEPGDVIARAATLSATAEEELGVAPDEADEGTVRAREVARLIGWAHELSEVRSVNGKRLFPGMREALPLLKGMARWSRLEQSAVDTARDFTASVLRRDLAVGAQQSANSGEPTG